MNHERIAKDCPVQAIPIVTNAMTADLISICPTCKEPTHATESNDEGQCYNCARPENVKLTDGLVPYRGWRASYEFPRQIEWRHRHTATVVYSTPDHETHGWLSVQVQGDDGCPVVVPKTSANMGEGIDEGAEIPFPVRTSDALFAAVKPWLDMHYPEHPAYLAILKALDEHVEGGGGPQGKEYVDVMERLVVEIERRVEVYLRERTGR